MKKPSRAQSSLEFLTTYMWAVMLLLVMLGFLYYLGAFSGLRYSPPACYVMEGVSCTSYAIYGNSSGFVVAFSGQNNLGFDIGFDDNAVAVTAENLGLAGKNTYAGDCYSSNPANPPIVEDGRNYTCMVVIGYTQRVPQPGDVESLQIVFNYKNCGADPSYPSTKNCNTQRVVSHSSAGSIYARVESLAGSSLETLFCGNGVCDTPLGETAGSCSADCQSSRAYTVILTAEPTSIPADGASTSALTATVYDQFNNPYQTTDDPVHFQIVGAYGTVSPPENATNASGISLATLTSSAVPAAITVNATCENISAYATVTAYSTILPGWVYGYVLDGSGAGVEGALVNVTNATGSPTNVTEGSGYFIVYGLDAGTYQMRASKTGYSDGMSTSVVSSGAGTETNLTLVIIVEEGWVLVPGNPEFGTDDFLVMKYEAKNVGGVATSNYSGTPWVSINQTDAQAACEAVGAHLLSTAEAQTINRDVASVSSNWLSGSVGSGCMYGGHMECDGAPCNVAFNASSNDAEGWWNGTSNVHNEGVQNCPFTAAEDRGNETRRTFTLSNGQVVWDWSGNVWEWMNGSCQAGNGTGYWYNSGGWVEWSNSNLDDFERATLGPSVSSWTSSKGVGRYYGCTANGNAFLRGGDLASGLSAGAFMLYLNYAPSSSSSPIGFRCAKSAPSALGWVYGYVLDGSGAGVEGALVNVTNATGSPANVTEGSGYFVVYGLDAGTYQLKANKTGYSDGMSTSVVSSGAGTETNLTLVIIVEEGWVLVPGNSEFGTDDFLVMKYEAKNVGGVATSNYSGTPWVSINQTDAQAACEAVGAHLLSTAEAQTINRDVASVSSNWLSGSVGSGCMYGGHMECDGAPCNVAFN
ncbi:MAG: carboxypeptidase regulatory-like domain-containing protein, partial [Candidatus ainarchaeum sp.]|nr:carboxypeptidase regulatory-like domain-containing protein [Candidatus ainarchaeum sp.]